MPMKPFFSPEQAREILRQIEEHGMSHRELARQYGCGQSTIGRTVRRLREQKREEAAEGLRPVDGLEGIKVGPEVRVYSDGLNQAEITNTPDSLIHTLDQLLEYCQVDQDVWVVRDRELTAWPGWRKDKKVDMRWVKGVADGYVLDTGGIVTHQLIRVFARLVKRCPVPVFPHIQPVVSDYQWTVPELRSYSGRIKKTLGMADLHVGFSRIGRGKNRLDPFHDRRAMDTAYRIAAREQPDEIVILGDKLDLPDWTVRYHRSPDIRGVTQPALLEVFWFLSRLRALLPNARIKYLAGNHEQRFKTMIEAHLPAAYALKSADDLDGWDQLSIPKLLGLESLGVEYIDTYPAGSHFITPTGRDPFADSLETEHGATARKGSGDTSKVIIRDRGNSVLSGHIHRPELVTKVDRRGGLFKPIQAVCPGCLCRLTGEVPGHDPKRQDWAHGVAIIYSDESTGFWDSDLVKIFDGRAIVNGVVVQGEDYTEELREVYPEYGY